MPTRIGGLQIARSSLTPSGAATLAQAVAFNLQTGLGIELVATFGQVGIIATAAAGNSEIDRIMQTLHFNPAGVFGELENVPFAAGDDEDEDRSEVAFLQEAGVTMIGDADSQSVTVYGTQQTIVYPERQLFTIRDLTHRVETTGGSLSMMAHLLIYYYLVRLTNDEIVAALAGGRG